MNGAMISVPGESQMDKKIKRIVRKQVTNALAKILGKSLLDDRRGEKPTGILRNGTPEQSLNDCVNVYGFLINTLTKKTELIFGARQEHFPTGVMVFYNVEDNKLFTKFPAAGAYQGPYKDNKPVFLEVIAYVDGMYV